MSSKWASIFEDIKRIYSSIPKLIYIAPLKKKKKKKINIYSIKFMPINLLSNIIRSCVEIDDARIISQMRSSRMGPSSYILILKKRTGAMMHRCGVCHGASDAKVRTNSPSRWEKFCLTKVRVSGVLSLPFSSGAHVYIYIYIYICVCADALLYPLGHRWWYSFSLLTLLWWANGELSFQRQGSE